MGFDKLPARHELQEDDFVEFKFPPKTGEELYISSYKIQEWDYIRCDKCRKAIACTPSKNLPLNIKIICMECELN